VDEKTVEWNLGFAYDEVIAGLEKLLSEGEYAHTRAETAAETHFQVTLAQGTLGLKVQPLPSHQSPFNPYVSFHRTLVVMTFSEVGRQDEETFLHRLTLRFLRAGG
jgi:hypothetical protein